MLHLLFSASAPPANSPADPMQGTGRSILGSYAVDQDCVWASGGRSGRRLGGGSSVTACSQRGSILHADILTSQQFLGIALAVY